MSKSTIPEYVRMQCIWIVVGFDRYQKETDQPHGKGFLAQMEATASALEIVTEGFQPEQRTMIREVLLSSFPKTKRGAWERIGMTRKEFRNYRDQLIVALAYMLQLCL